MDNIYDIKPLKIMVINPYNSNITDTLTLPTPSASSRIQGGDYISKDKLQRADFSILDKNIENLKDLPTEESIQHEGNPYNIMVYPFDNIVDIRNKIFIATGIHPYRQHLLLTYSDNIISLTYSIYLGQNLVECNIFNKLQNITENAILNIPIDKELVNSKEDINVDMNDTFTILKQSSNRYITRILVCDLYTIINPSNENIRNILTASEFQRDLLYYGFIIKFFPILPLHAFEQLYIKGGSISSISTFLHPDFNRLLTNFKNEKEILNKYYNLSDNMIKYYKKYKSKLAYAIIKIVADIKIPLINIRNFFDLFILDETFIFAVIKIIINGKEYIIDKKYSLYTEKVEIFTSKILVDSIIIRTNDNIDITIFKNTITMKKTYNENEQMTFSCINNNLKRIVYLLIDYINKLGLIVIIDGANINKERLLLNIINSDIITYWPENFSSDHFSLLRKHIAIFENINLLTVLASPIGSYNCIINQSSSQINVQKKFNLLQLFPTIKNQFEYYTNTDFRNKWNLMGKKTLSFIQKASNTAVTFQGFVNNDFHSMFMLIYTLIYDFVKSLKGTKKIAEIAKDTKVLAKLRGTDPELFNVRRHDPSYQVYAIKCQAERQPLIYKPYELQYLSNNIKNKLIKFWNYTEQKPVFYYCPNKTYPHLSFRPIDHPLGYCLPCCKKLVPSEGSRQSKIDIACYEKHILPHKEIDEIIKKIDRDSLHLLTYGKEIPVGRYSRISSVIEDNILLSKTLYRLLGVKQIIPLFKIGGFIFSIINCLGISLEDFVKDVVKIINNNILQLLDEGHTQSFSSTDQFREVLTNILLDTKRLTIGSNILSIDWINIISELTYMVYGYHIIIINDNNNVVKMRMLNTTQVCLLNEDCDSSYIIISSHEDGIYPLVELKSKDVYSKIDKRYFSRDDNIVLALTDILKKEHQKIETVGIDLNNIFEFIQVHKKYSISYLLRGKRGLIYSVILLLDHNEIYVPCIYSQYIDKKYKIRCCDFPNINNFKRKNLYDFIDSYNCFLVKKHRKVKLIPYIEPFAVIRHEGNYMGIKIRYMENTFGLTFYHSPEKTIGRYDVETIDIPYSIMAISNAINKSTKHLVHPHIGEYAYHNYVYSLFLIEFAFELRKHKNEKVRKCLTDVLKNKSQVDRRLIKECLKDYDLDYKTIIKLLSLHQAERVLGMLQHMIFDFDMILLQKLKKLDKEKRLTEIKNLMKPFISFSTNSPDISNILASCQINYALPQCSRGKLIMNQKNFDKCCGFLAKDLEIPYIFETISLRISDTRNELMFTKRANEILHISEEYDS